MQLPDTEVSKRQQVDFKKQKYIEEDKPRERERKERKDRARDDYRHDKSEGHDKDQGRRHKEATKEGSSKRNDGRSRDRDDKMRDPADAKKGDHKEKEGREGGHRDEDREERRRRRAEREAKHDKSASSSKKREGSEQPIPILQRKIETGKDRKEPEAKDVQLQKVGQQQSVKFANHHGIMDEESDSTSGSSFQQHSQTRDNVGWKAPPRRESAEALKPNHSPPRAIIDTEVGGASKGLNGPRPSPF